jgi:hypothetical protein
MNWRVTYGFYDFSVWKFGFDCVWYIGRILQGDQNIDVRQNFPGFEAIVSMAVYPVFIIVSP